MYQIGILYQHLARSSKGKLPTFKEVFPIFEKNLRVTSGEALTGTFVRIALSVWKLLSYEPVKEALLLGEELFGKRNGLTNSIYKLESLSVLCQGDNDRCLFTILHIFDLMLNGQIASNDLNYGPLTGRKMPNNKG